MKRMLKVVEIGWIVVAVICLVELSRLWGEFDERFWIFLGILLVAAFMFFFRRKQRRRYEQSMRKEEENQ